MTAARTAADSRATRSVRIDEVRRGRRRSRSDSLTVEEPLEVRLRHGDLGRQVDTVLGITMRTPGHDAELAAGLLLSEGIVSKPGDITHVTYCRSEAERQYGNAILVEVHPRVHYDPSKNERSYLRTSACGVCGRASIETLRLRRLRDPSRRAPRVKDGVLRALPARLREAQQVFASTGSLHAAALFDPRGQFLGLREDVGRHNAVDKLVGSQYLDGRIPRSDAGLLVSGRASYEILQKALAAGVPFVAAIGAPSSLAVDLATEFGQTLVGFLKPDGYNVYAGGRRVVH